MSRVPKTVNGTRPHCNCLGSRNTSAGLVSHFAEKPGAGVVRIRPLVDLSFSPFRQTLGVFLRLPMLARIPVLAVSLTFAWSMSSSTIAFPGRPPLHLVWEKEVAIICCDIIGKKQIHNELAVQIQLAGQIQSHPRLKGLMRYFQPIVGASTPQLNPGDRVLVFLRWDGEKQYFHSEFTLQIEPPHTGKVFTRVLRQLPAIMAQPDAAQRDAQLRDWYIECLLHSETRYEGILGLHKQHRAALTDEQWQRFVDTFVAEQPPQQYAGEFARMLQGRKSRELDEHLLKSLHLCYRPGWEDLSRTAFDILPQRLGIEYGESIQQQKSELGEIGTWVWGGKDERLHNRDELRHWRERYHVQQGAMYRDAWYRCNLQLQQPVMEIKRDLGLSGKVSIVRLYATEPKHSKLEIREEAVILRSSVDESAGSVDSPNPFDPPRVVSRLVEEQSSAATDEKNATYELQYVYRYPNTKGRRSWQLWINVDLIPDGTGAESPAIRRYDHNPSENEITEFRSETINHWSRR